VDSSFLQYDYALGRLNAYSFLKRHLAIPENANNPIFARWDANQRDQYRFEENGTKYLPLIPLMSTVREPTLPRWPTINDVPAALSNAINARLDAVYGLATAQSAADTWWKRALMSSYLWLGWRLYLRGALRDFALSAIRRGLAEQRLLAGNP
jgi:hypothetical protein